MKEKFLELQKCFSFGNILSMGLIAYYISNAYNMFNFDLQFWMEIFIIQILLTFYIAGIIYGIKKTKLRFSLNPIYIIFMFQINIFKIAIFTLIYPIYFLITFFKYRYEIKKSNV